MPSRKKVKSEYEEYILNCIPSEKTEQDWTFEDAIASEALSPFTLIPKKVDLREDWWNIRDQKETGACVGFGAADGLLRWHFVKMGRITKKQRPAPRFIWMANKETDELTSYPTTFLEKSGTQTKLALRVARNYGCVLENVLPMVGSLSYLKTSVFYTKAAALRIASYHNIGTNTRNWKAWLAFQGPILTRLGVDRTWDQARRTHGHLKTYYPGTVRGGHAVCLVGYTPDYFIVRNSWGTGWGDGGFGYASNAYAKKAFTEAYGAVL